MLLSSQILPHVTVWALQVCVSLNLLVIHVVTLEMALEKKHVGQWGQREMYKQLNIQ